LLSGNERPLAFPEDHGRLIQRARVLLDITQAELAERAGITVRTLYRAERGFPARHSSLEKIANGLNMSLDELLREKPVMDGTAQAYVLHRAAENVWSAPIDRRRNVPEDNETRVRSASERRRLGLLGLTPLFLCYPVLVMPEGPGATLLEVYGRYENAINPEVYRDAMMHCLRGGVRLGILDEIVELGEGDFVGYVSRNLRWIEPVAPLGENDPVSLVLWFGAVRLGRVHTMAKRPIVRKPRKPV